MSKIKDFFTSLFTKKAEEVQATIEKKAQPTGNTVQLKPKGKTGIIKASTSKSKANNSKKKK